ncbi:hypothetical protein [Herbaspirillum rubrisubalbicans]|uniref:hypothetical protein n=1 Tax=Herbaspirillum rubrisubalbicans TaxID=80842 RepID=UPI000363D50A|nr:hypothetical protein [Herbaspirillum rubrisubalbicans]
MSSKRRLILLLSVLALSVLAAFFVSRHDEQDDQLSSAITRSSPASPSAIVHQGNAGEGKTILHIAQIRRDALTVGEQNPFAPKSWYVPPPAAPAPVVEKPAVPPLPFSYVGRVDDADGKWIIYLAKGAQSYVVQSGDTIDNTYRIENIEDGSLVIRYLPMDSKQTLQIGEAL